MTQKTLKAASGKLVFILGHPLDHSLSPAMQNAAFQKAGLPWLYLPMDITQDKIRSVLSTMRILPVSGANVTIPYKKAVLPYLDWVEAEAKWLGSVNTIYRKGKKLCGTSTDGEGFLRSLGAFRSKLRGTTGLLLGAGGAARAIAGALARSGVNQMAVVNRSPRRAERLVQSLKKRYPRLKAETLSIKEAEKFLTQCDWVIQTTSVGLKKGDPSPISLKNAGPATLAVDLIYHRETDFLKQAKVRRLPRLDGMGMLLHQGALSFEKWTGKKAPLEVMRRVLLRRLGSL